MTYFPFAFVKIRKCKQFVRNTQREMICVIMYLNVRCAEMICSNLTYVKWSTLQALAQQKLERKYNNDRYKMLARTRASAHTHTHTTRRTQFEMVAAAAALIVQSQWQVVCCSTFTIFKIGVAHILICMHDSMHNIRIAFNLLVAHRSHSSSVQ